jgi:tRNA pseudouridine38-40 synthase
MHKFAALFSYTGTRYCGWQRQAGSAAGGGPSIQATIEEALQRMTGEAATVVGSGRTDAGVHALAQRAHWVIRSEHKVWKPEVFKNGLNSHLPQDIRVLEVREVPMDFHAQHSAERKQYSFYFQQGPCPLPHLSLHSWWIRKRLDVAAMQKALDSLRGKHDFKPFQAAGAKPVPTVKTIFEAQAVAEPIGFPGRADSAFFFVRVRLLGDGFLRQMVRGIAGTLLQIGEGRRDPDCIREILRGGDRSSVGPTAQARGLWLERVWYPERFGLGD